MDIGLSRLRAFISTTYTASKNKLTRFCHFERTINDNTLYTSTGKPEPPYNCTLTNQTTQSLSVECTPGFDGGQTQHFQLEVYDQLTDQLRANVSSRDNAVFHVHELESGRILRMDIYAINSKGRSASTLLEGFTLKVAEKQTGESLGFCKFIYHSHCLFLFLHCDVFSLLFFNIFIHTHYIHQLHWSFISFKHILSWKTFIKMLLCVRVLESKAQTFISRGELRTSKLHMLLLNVLETYINLKSRPSVYATTCSDGTPL